MSDVRTDPEPQTVAPPIGLMEERLEAGVDEVGRGALAGPLFAAAVILPSDVEIEGLRDSKLCTRAQRERLAVTIKEVALAYSVARVQPQKIDRTGLQRCNREVFRRSLKGLEVAPDYVLIDFLRLKRFRLPWPGVAVKKADAVSKNVAAASILAKVTRDASMRRYHRKHPEYGFDTNVGYGTREHWDALIRHGPSPIHRRSFYGVEGFMDERGVFHPHLARNLDDEVTCEDDGSDQNWADEETEQA